MSYEEENLKRVNIILFDDFTALDAFGPAEVFAKTEAGCDIRYYSRSGGAVTCSIQNKIETEKTDAIDRKDILIIPGGIGTRRLVGDEDFIRKLKTLASVGKRIRFVRMYRFRLAFQNRIVERQKSDEQ